MGAIKTLGEGVAILRAIAKSDAVKDVRDKLRDQATRLADNRGVPRVVSGPASVVAALLAESDIRPQDVDHGEPVTEPEPGKAEAMVDAEPLGPFSDQDDDEEMVDEPEIPEEVAAVRDLEPSDTLVQNSTHSDETEQELDDLEDDERLLRFDHDEGLDLGAVDAKPAAKSPIKAPSKKKTREKGATPGTKKRSPAKQKASKAPAARAQKRASKASPAKKQPKSKAPKPQAAKTRKPASAKKGRDTRPKKK